MKYLIFLLSILSVVHAILPGIGEEDTLTQDRLVSCERIKYNPEGPYVAHVRATLITEPVKDVPIPIVIVRYADIDNIESFPLATSEDLAIGEEEVDYQNILYRDRSGFNITLVDETRPIEYLNSVFTAKDQEIVFNVSHSGTYCVYISKGSFWNEIKVDLEFRDSHGYIPYQDYSMIQLQLIYVLIHLILVLMVYTFMPDPPKMYLVTQLGLKALVMLLGYAHDSYANHNPDTGLPSWYVYLLFKFAYRFVIETNIFFALGLWTVHGWNFNAIPHTSRYMASIYVIFNCSGYVFLNTFKNTNSLWGSTLSGLMSISFLLSIIIRPMIILSLYSKTKLSLANTPQWWITRGIGLTLLGDFLLFLGEEAWGLVKASLSYSQFNSQDMLGHLQAVADADIENLEPLSISNEIGKSLLELVGRLIVIYFIWRNISLKKEKI
ncbi:hypothetical protein CAAN1_22S01266 [[Candida] anglica]|uniref:Intimal thickness related receptor IRP domain-containing protein n=1 Tax=[Candida] anglica TaxID=148631 RepID=A0ABP0E9B4_9ASCO